MSPVVQGAWVREYSWCTLFPTAGQNVIGKLCQFATQHSFEISDFHDMVWSTSDFNTEGPKQLCSLVVDITMGGHNFLPQDGLCCRFFAPNNSQHSFCPFDGAD